jgi:hypothetical protein
MARGIVGEHDITGAETPYRTIAGFDLDLSGEGDDILTPRRVVKIAQMGCRRATKDNAMRRLELGNFHFSFEVELNIYFFEMGFVIRSGEKSNDLHQSACRKIGRELQAYSPQRCKVRRVFILTLSSPRPQRLRGEPSESFYASRLRGQCFGGAESLLSGRKWPITGATEDGLSY